MDVTIDRLAFPCRDPLYKPDAVIETVATIADGEAIYRLTATTGHRGGHFEAVIAEAFRLGKEVR